MKAVFTTFLLAFGLVVVQAQCPTENVTLTTQADVDAFGLYWPNCTDLPYSLTIDGDNITNLLGLQNLSSMGGYLRVYDCYALTSLAGLENISSVSGNLWVYNNDALTSLTGLENLNSVGGRLAISENDILLNLTGLENIGSVGGNLEIHNNAALSSLTGLENIGSVGGNLEIHNNAALSSLTGLENLSSLGGYLSIDDNYYLTSIAGLENLSSVSGYLSINNNYHLTSLAGLENLSSVGGYLYMVSNSSLTSLAGLENLSSVGGYLYMANNSSLTSLVGLENLNSVSGELSIAHNNALMSLAGLENISSVSANLYIYYNGALTSLTGLGNLSSVGGYLEITYNDALANLTGLENLSSVSGISISHNDVLTNLAGLENVNSVNGYLYIAYNDALTNLVGLENLSSVGWYLEIDNNHALTSLAGLESLSSVGDLSITYNPNLSVCNILAICQHLQSYDPTIQDVNIYNNASGCNSEEEVMSNCSSFFSHVSGQVYADIDCDSTFDAIDAYIPNILVTKANGTPIMTTNSGGEYLILLALSSPNTISVNAPSGYTAYPDTYQIVTDTVVTAYTGYDFRLCPDSLFSDASVSIAALDPPQPGFNNAYHVCYQNTGTLPTDATLTLTFSGEAAVGLSIVNAGGGMVSGNSITWSLTDVPVFGQGCFTVVVSLLPATPLGSQLTASANILVVSDDIADSFENTQEVVGSYDPNDKSVSPTEIDFATAEGPQRLTYTVRFQNTGTFPATFVKVLDTLEANLDITTLQLLSASHAYTLTVLHNHILKFRFEDINLPDSTTDEAGSHGYIMFSLETVAGLQLGDVVSNSAAIYFDFNAPVITNTATSTFVIPSPNPRGVLQLRVLPNPTHNTTTVFFEGSNNTKIELLNTLGSVIQQHDVSGSSLTLDVSGLPSGVYIIRATSGAGMGAAKLVKE